MAGHVAFTNDRMYTIVADLSADTVEALMSSVVAEDRPLFEAAIAAVLANQSVDDVEIRLRSPATQAAPDAGSERVCAR